MKNKNASNVSIRKIAYCGLFIALGITLPFLTAIPQVGNSFLLMHLPILVCGIVCGGKAAGFAGALTPLLRSFLVGFPVLYPNAVGMAFELAAYGFVMGILTEHLPRRLPFYYISLIASMLTGRAVWGIVRFLMLLIDSQGAPFALSMFIGGAFTNAVPGIIIQLAFIPFLAMYLNKKADLPIKN
ncbi:MAG: ECF transporter S component [Clostridia bacterium]|nr:ECF transporter S component [Clostridia bacterium]